MAAESPGFAHLHNHTMFSTLDAIQRLDEMCRAAVEDGQTAIAATDHGTLAGLWKLRKAAAKAGIKPILGLEAYLAIGSRHERNVEAVTGRFEGEKVRRYQHLTLLARNHDGWRNLLALNNRAAETVWYKPRIDLDLLAEHARGLTIGSGCLGGPVASRLLEGDRAGARAALGRLREIAEPGHLFVEVMDHGIPAERAIQADLVGLARELGLPVVATNDAHYTHEHERDAHDAWLAVGVKAKISDPTRFRFDGGGYHLRTAAQMREVFARHPAGLEAVANTLLVAQAVEPDVVGDSGLKLPRFHLPPGHPDVPRWGTHPDEAAYLHHLVLAGAKARYGPPVPQAVKDRLRAEEDVIAPAGISGYFLIVKDMVDAARAAGHRTGFGRGCLRGDSLVWTAAGYKPIREVRVGDQVRTHTGVLRPVTNTFRYEVDEPLVAVHAYHGGRPTTMTADHKVLVRRAELERDTKRLRGAAVWAQTVTSPLDWVAAGSVHRGDLVCIPRPDSPGTAPASIDVAALLPPPPPGVEFEVTDDEIIERVPTNITFRHSTREVSRATGVTRNAIRSILSTGVSFTGPISAYETRNTSAERMRGRLRAELDTRGFGSLGDYREHLGRHAGATRYPHSAHTVGKSVGLSHGTLRNAVENYPDEGPIRQMRRASIRQVTARDTLAAELRRRGFTSFEKWARYVGEHRTVEVRTPRHIPVDDDLLFILGAYVSNGWVCRDAQRSVGFAERRSSLDDLIPSTVGRIWGLQASRNEHATRDLTQTYVHSAAVRTLFHHLVPGYDFTALTKRLPEWHRDLTIAQKKVLLSGLWRGDGSTTGGHWRYSTSSEVLMTQVRELLWAVGAPAGVAVDERADDREEFKNRAVSWRISTTRGFTAPLARYGWVDDDYVYARVRRVERVEPVTEVFDIEVPGDHSFMTDSYVVHNSAGGTLTGFVLGIHGVDPLANGLLFERFLDPSRVGMPDIDSDFDEAGAAWVASEYLPSRWGADHVARIGSFGMSLSRRAIRAVATAAEASQTGDALARLVPVEEGGRPASFARLLDPSNAATRAFRDRLAVDPDAARVARLAAPFEGVVANESIHACGILVSDRPLDELVPTRVDARTGVRVTAWDGKDVEEHGMLKLDDLAIRNLTVVSRALELIEARTGERVDVDSLDMDAGDERTRAAWRLLGEGRTAGVFQVESPGMARLCSQVRPDSHEDLSAVLALYRPGPMGAGMHERFAARKHGLEPVDYGIYTPVPAEQAAIASVLEPTFGLCIAAGEKVHSVSRGYPVPIEQIRVGERVQSIDETTGVHVPARVTHTWAKGRKDTVRVRFSSGGTLRCTKDHLLLTVDGWKAAGELGSGDALCAPSRLLGKDHPVASGSRWVAVASVEPAGQTAVHDLSVEGHHSFVVQGVVAHNCTYQEQLMSLSTAVAGFTAAERNRLRKAFSKKIRAEMDALKEQFMAGATSQMRLPDGTTKIAFRAETAESLWRTFDASASYLFNKCVAGDTVVLDGELVPWTVEQLYSRLHGNDGADPGLCPCCQERPRRRHTGTCRRCESWQVMFNDPGRGFHLLAVDSADGRIRPQRVAGVHANGVKEVFTVRTARGRELTMTANHRVLTPSGYRRCDQLAPGDELVSHEGHEPPGSQPAYRSTAGSRRDRPGRAGLPGPLDSGRIDGGSVAPEPWAEATIKTAACGRWEKGHVPGTDTVIEVVPAGEQLTYDVQMADGTGHNFVANGIVSHNSHAAAYAVLTFVTAYLKASWPAEYGAALLSRTDRDDKRVGFLAALRDEGLAALPPDVNAGGMDTTVDKQGRIRLGLAEVKGAGAHTAAIVAERQAGGPFGSLADLVARVRVPTDRPAITTERRLGPAGCHACLRALEQDGEQPQEQAGVFGVCECDQPRTQPRSGDGPRVQTGADGTVVKVAMTRAGGRHRLVRTVKAPVRDADGCPVMATDRLSVGLLEALIEAGACDGFGPRAGLIAIARAVRDCPEIPVPDLRWGVVEQAARQRDRLGVVLGQHPMQAVGPQVAAWCSGDGRRGSRPVPVHRLAQAPTSQPAVTAGVIAVWEERSYSRGRMARVVLEGSRASLDAVVWDAELAALRASGQVPAVGDVVALTGMVRRRADRQRVRELDDGGPDTSGPAGTSEGGAPEEPPERVEMNVQLLWRGPLRDDACMILHGGGPLLTRHLALVPNGPAAGASGDRLGSGGTAGPEPPAGGGSPVGAGQARALKVGELTEVISRLAGQGLRPPEDLAGWFASARPGDEYPQVLVGDRGPVRLVAAEPRSNPVPETG